MSEMFWSHEEICREGRRVLRAMSDGGCHLAPDGDGRFVLTGNVTRAPRGKRRGDRAVAVAASIVFEFRKRDWVKPLGTRPETFSLSEAGSGWLTRELAEADPFKAQHQSLVQRRVKSDGGEETVTVNEAESPLSLLRSRDLITAQQYEAGDKLRADYTMAQMTPRLCTDLVAPVSNSRKPTPIVETVIAAKQRFRLAMTAAGPGLSDLLFNVCCQLRGLESVEGQNQWPSRSARIVLQIALDRLAAHYGIAARGAGHGRLRRWQSQSGSSGGSVRADVNLRASA